MLSKLCFCHLSFLNPIGGMGYSWQFALTAILLEGLIFIILTITKARDWIVNSIPDSIKKAIGGGIGLFLAFIGMQSAGFVSPNESTLVALGDLHTKECLLFIVGLIITSILVVRNVKGGILIGIVATTLIGLPFGITKLHVVISAPPSIAPIFCKFELHENNFMS